MMVFRPRDKVALQAGFSGARLMMLGGAMLNGPRYIWWNFVALSKERIEEAWRPGDEDEVAVAPEDQSAAGASIRSDLASTSIPRPAATRDAGEARR